MSAMNKVVLANIHKARLCLKSVEGFDKNYKNTNQSKKT